MELYKIALRVVFAYLVLLVLLRLGGKRLVGEASPRDFVLAIIMGDLIDDVLWAEVSAATFVSAAGALLLLEVIAAVACARGVQVWRLFNGKPRLAFAEGAPVRRGLRAERVNEKTLDELLRLRGIGEEQKPDVRQAYLEIGGGLSVRLADAALPAQRVDLPKVKRLLRRAR
jgi:uncharacterized membrane protein YcaP (DUF421 family)